MLTPEQVMADTLAFAKQQYGDRQSIHGRSLLEHCCAVAKLAEFIAHKLYQDVRAEYVPEDSIATIVQGAMLHDVINVRCAFEEVAEKTTVQIAALVAALSRDFRLVETKRDMDFRGRLAASPVSTQIVAVADIMCSTKEVTNMLTAEGMAAIPRAKKLLTQLDGDLLAIHAAKLFYVLRLYTHAARNQIQDAAKMIKECRQQAKMARMLAQTSENVRRKMAAKISTPVEESSSKKELSRGKKRTSRRDS